MNTGKKSPVVRQLAVSLTKGLIQKDWNSEVNTLYKFVRDRIRYVRDINGVETLHTPEKILENAAGDCDDKSVLLASLLESLGYKTRLVAVGFRKNSFSHVYPEVLHNNSWVSLETTEPVAMGWKPKNIVTSLILNVGESNNVLHGLDGKRVERAIAAMGVALQEAYAKAELPEATQDDIDKANKMAEAYDLEINRYKIGAKQKSKKIGAKFLALRVAAHKAQSKFDPFQKAMYESDVRQKKLKGANLRYIELQGQKPSIERDAEINAIAEQVKSLSKKEKKFQKQFKIVMLIVSIVVGIFTFGGGTAAIQGAYQALRAGLVALAKSILMSAAVSAAAKGASAKDVKKAKQVANDLEAYPPDPSLKTFDEMMQDSQMKKQAAQEKTSAVLIPAGIIAALTFLS